MGALLVPVADGVGLLEDGTRVYFAFPRAPIGAMAETVAVDALCCVAIPGMSSWSALQERAGFKPGAAGASGRLAIQVANHRGASRVVATAHT